MIVDTSAVVAIAFKEADALEYAEALTNATSVRMGAPTYVEAAVVIARQRGIEAVADLNELLQQAGVGIVAFNHAHALAARRAYDRYGRGSGHPARLNYGDCLAYAIAEIEDEPLLFKGEDFARTDVRPALRRR